MNMRMMVLALGFAAGVSTLGAAEVAALKPFAAKEISNPVYEFGVKDGKPVKGRSFYAPENLKSTGDGKVLFVHDQGDARREYQVITWDAPDFFDAKTGVCAVEWRIRVVSQQEKRPDCFMLIVRTGESKKIIRNAYFRIGKDHARTPWGVFPVDAFSKPVVCRVLVDRATGDAALYIDGKFIAGGPVRAVEAPKLKAEMVFGDGSNEVGGQVEIDYFKVGAFD